MILLTLLACLRFPDTDAANPADSQDTSGSGCAGQEGDPSSVTLNAFTVNGLPVFGSTTQFCMLQGGLISAFVFDLSGESATLLVGAPGVGSYNLPDPEVVMEAGKGGLSWEAADLYAGTLSVTESGGTLFGDLQAEASNLAGEQLIVGVSWVVEP